MCCNLKYSLIISEENRDKISGWCTFILPQGCCSCLCKRWTINIFVYFSGFCKSLKRDSDKVVMVYSVEIYDSMYSTQWFNGEKLCYLQRLVIKNACARLLQNDTIIVQLLTRTTEAWTSVVLVWLRWINVNSEHIPVLHTALLMYAATKCKSFIIFLLCVTSECLSQ